MRILVLGGTVFLGRTFVELALEAGHEVTLFHRGEHNPGLFDEAEWIRGDRRRDLDALEGRTWDAVLDTCGYFPRDVALSARALSGSVGSYAFVSSVSVYEDHTTPGLTEDAPLARMDGVDPAEVEEITGASYGPLKAACEETLAELLPGRVLLVRPGLIVGPWDPTDRFTWWPHRIRRGGEVLAPGSPERTIQCIDVRDLAGWILHMLEARRDGVFHVTGEPTAMATLLDRCRKMAGAEADLTWVPEAFLQETDAEPWTELPLWFPGGEDRISIARAEEEGLELRALDETIRATLDWIDEGRDHESWRAGLDPKKERRILERWRAQGS